MCKMFVFLVCIALLIPTFIFTFGEKNFFEKFSGLYRVYISSSQEFEMDNVNKIKNGNITILESSNINREKIMKYVDCYFGESLTIMSGVHSINEVFSFLSFKNLQIEQIDNITCYIGYCKGFSKFIMYENKRINIQIAVRDNMITVGFPIILGSY